MRGDRDVDRGLGVEVVRGLAHVEAGGTAESRGRAGSECLVSVDAGPDRGPPEGHDRQLGDRPAGPANRLLDLAGVAPKLLAEADRRRILEVRPARLDDRPEL